MKLSTKPKATNGNPLLIARRAYCLAVIMTTSPLPSTAPFPATSADVEAGSIGADRR